MITSARIIAVLFAVTITEAHLNVSEKLNKEYKNNLQNIETTKKFEREKWQLLFWDLINKENIRIPSSDEI